MPRLKAIKLPIEFLTSLFTEHKSTLAKCIEGLPMDAEFIYAFTPPQYQQRVVYLVYSHPDFDEVCPGGLAIALLPDMVTYKGADLLIALTKEWKDERS